MSKTPRIDRKSLKGPDEFQKTGTLFLDFIAAHRPQLLGLVIGFAAVVVAVLAWNSYSSHRLDKAWVVYDEAMKAPEAQRWDKLKGMVPSSPRNRPAYFAAVALGDHYFDEAKKEAVKDPSKVPPSAVQAHEWFNRALQFKSALPSEKQLVTVNRGNSSELAQGYDAAETDYKAAAEMEGDAKAWALLNLARAFELKKDRAQAEATYQKVSTDFLNTEYAKIAKNQLRRLKSPLFASLKP